MRTSEQIVAELDTINSYLLKGIPDNDISVMLTGMSTLVTYLASSAALVSEAGRIYNKTKQRAYNSLAMSSEANRQYYSAMLAKDFISAKCGDEFYAYEFAQRVNSAVTHALDAIRTAISAEKQLVIASSYSPNVRA